MASPKFDPSWLPLPAGTEIPELRTPASRTYSNGNGTFTADITPWRAGGADSQDSCQPISTGWIEYFRDSLHNYYSRHTPELHYSVGDTCGAAYAKFDLSSIPDSSTILSADVRCYQYEVGGPFLRTLCLYPGDIDPDTAGDQALFEAIRDGEWLAEVHSQGTGWVEYGLAAGWLARLQGRLPEDWVGLGIYPDTWAGSAYGIDGNEKQPRLRVVYLRPDEPDIQALHTELATYPAVAQRADTGLLVLTNAGVRKSDTFWAYASLEPRRESTLVEPIAVGETVSVRIELPITYTHEGFRNYHLWVDDAADDINDNDSMLLRCWLFPATTNNAAGFDGSTFPPPGWVAADNGGGSFRWTRQPGDSGSHSGAGFASCRSESTGYNDDWLVSDRVCPRRDYRDSVGFFARCRTASYPDTLELWILSGRQLPVLIASMDIRDTAYARHAVSLDEADGDTVKVAFRYRLSGANNGLCLDDIWFSHVYTPDTGRVEQPQRDVVLRASPKLPALAFVPNPSSRGVVTVSSFLAVGRRRSLAVRSVVGRVVLRSVLDPSGRTRLDLRGLPSGVYMATLEGGTQSLTRKLVITAR